MNQSAKLTEDQSIMLLSAIAHPVRLSAFRQLAVAGFSGLSARQIAEKIGSTSAALSSHLGVLVRADLLRADKSATPTRYVANVKLLRALAAYLGDQCVGAK